MTETTRARIVRKPGLGDEPELEYQVDEHSDPWGSEKGGQRSASVVSHVGGAEFHYLIGPQRETRAEAEDDLTLWNLLDLAPKAALAAAGPDEVETAIRNLRTVLEGREGLVVRAGRTAHRGPAGTRKGRMFIVITVEDGEL